MRILAVLLLALLMPLDPAAGQTPVGNGFTYQGQLTIAGTIVDEPADLKFTLHDAALGGTAVGSTVSLNAVAVNNGVFSVELDFGVGAFAGDERWLEIEVRVPSEPAPGTGPYLTLSPRQEITAVPYALHALNGGGGGGLWQAVGSAITNNNGGFVGINGTTPLTGAEVFGVRSPAASGYAGMYMSLAGIDGWPFYGYDANGRRAWTYFNGTTQDWKVYNGGDRLVVKSNGNVGIGVSDPASKLEVGGLIHSTLGGFKFPDGTIQTTAGGGGGGGADSDWQIAGDDMYNLNADQVMIGTQTPASGAKLTVGGGDLGFTTTEITGSLAGKLQLRGGAASSEILTAVDETRMATGSGQDLTFASGGNLFHMSGGFQQFHAGGTRWARISTAGLTEFFNPSNTSTVRIDGQGPTNLGGLIELAKSSGAVTMKLDGAGSNGTQGGAISLYNDINSVDATVVLDGEYGSNGGGALLLRNASGNQTIELAADLNPGDRSMIRLYKPDGTRTIEIDSEETGDVTQGGAIKLYDDAGNLTIELDADYGVSNEGRIITQVIEITGGSDLSENFDIITDDFRSVEAGSVVSIDPNSPGDLRPSTVAYDRRVAGIVSGAGNVRPGMLMGQRGTEADGRHPVALTGRVYCKVDASFGAIEPGDLLTTSATTGYAMKVSDHTRAQGAILGKAMTALEAGQGLVLVLVSLQ